MNMIEVFKTNVEDTNVACRMKEVLQQHFPSSRINFDLHDCDRILRMEGVDFTPEKVMGLVEQEGFSCSILDG